MYSITPPTARLSDFCAPKNQILFGDLLEAVTKIELSLINHGLFNPVIVMKEGPHLIIVDGGKRLAAMRRLHFQGRLPENLKHVPYIVVDDCRKMQDLYASKPFLLLSNRKHFDLVTSMYERGRTCKAIANGLFVNTASVRDILNIRGLSPTLQNEFFGDRLSLDQARALSSVEDIRIQDAIIRALGPFVEPEHILKAASLLLKKMKEKICDSESKSGGMETDPGDDPRTAAA